MNYLSLGQAYSSFSAYTVAVTLFVASILNAFAISPGIAEAQSVTIETSADEHNGRFLGGMLQVIIEDENADDEDDTIDVDIAVEEDGGASASSTFTIDDTSDGSQRFEFFLIHTDSPNLSPDDPVGATPNVITFGDGAEVDVTGFELYDGGIIDIQYGDEEVTIDYEETIASLSADREVYGSTSLVHLFIDDQDGNLDPTATDSFTVLEADLDVIFETTGAAFVDDLTFDETGDNTAQFEAVLLLSSVDTGTDPELAFSSESITMLLNDMANYDDTGFDNPENDSTDTSEISFAIDDVDGEMEELADLTFSGEIVIMIRDGDQNIDSEEEDTIDGAIFVELDNVGGDFEILDLEETDDNTGVFQIDLSNNELKMTFLADDALPIDNNGIFEFRAEDIASDVIISYFDPLDDNSSPSVTAEQVVELSVTAGLVDLPESVPIDGSFELILLDNDLNDNREDSDLYTVVLTGGAPYPLRRGGEVYGEMAQFEIIIDDESLNFASPIAIVLNETEINSGEFVGKIDLGEILASAGLEANNGEELEIIYNDLMGVPAKSSDTLIIGTPTPPSPSGMVADLIELAESNDVDANILKQASRLLEDNNPRNDAAVCGLLEAFSHKLQSQAGKKIDHELAEELEEAVTSIQDEIGC